MLRHNRRWAPVVARGSYAGVVGLADLAAVPRDERTRRQVGEVAHDVPPASPSEPVDVIADRLRRSGAGAMVVTDDHRIIGIVTMRDLDNVELLVDRLSRDNDEQ
jgi:CBS domain-containing protein